MKNKGSKKINMLLSDISPAFENYPQRLKGFQKSQALPFWEQEVEALIKLLDKPVDDIDAVMGALQRVQRISFVYAADLQNNSDFLKEFQAADFLKTWENYGAPPIEDALQFSVADKLYNVDRFEKPHPVLRVGEQSTVIAGYLVKKLMRKGIPFDVYFAESDFSALVLNHTADDKIPDMAEVFLEKTRKATSTMSVYASTGNRVTANPKKSSLFGAAISEFSDRILSGDLFYTLTVLPTHKDAEMDGIPYDDYIKLYFEMCDQPWERIEKAQAHLISKFDAAEEIRITNDDGTDITMSLVDHDGTPFTFANSVIAKNVPGSEIFSAPRRDSINGVIVAKGKYNDSGDASKTIENLTLHLKDGKIVDFDAEVGGKYFQEYLDRDPNNAYAGELGIGTNPHLGRHVINGLLVEKIGGSFHLAWGNCYQYKEYEGKPVHLSNGNETETGDHWDMTVMLRGHGGEIQLDGRVVMKNGRWVDPKLKVLNEGWASVAVNERPEYWKDFAGYTEDGVARWNEHKNKSGTDQLPKSTP